MYYPYFRGKQFDLAALICLIEEGKLSPLISPIIEPIRDNRVFNKFIAIAQQHNHPFFLIRNPQAGDFRTQMGTQKLLTIDAQRAWLLLDSLDSLNHSVDDLLVLHQSRPALESEWGASNQKVILPEEFRLLNHVKGAKILSSDSFTRLRRAREYEIVPDELFSNSHKFFSKKGFVGFSDFSIDSKLYHEYQRPDSVLVLHFVYFDNYQDLRIHHFLSSDELPSQKEKFFFMMKEVRQWERTLCLDQRTLGFNLLIDAEKKGHFPGMGVLRKATVMHHLEVMSRYLDRITDVGMGEEQ